MAGPDRDDHGHRWRGAVVASAALIAGWGGYLVLVYPPPRIEFAMGLAAGFIAACAAGVVVAVAWPGWGATRVAVRPLRLGWGVVAGFFRVAAVACASAPVRGALVTLPDEYAGRAGDEAGTATRRTVVGWTRSLAADSFVVAFRDDGSRVEHQLPASAEAAS